MREYLFVFMLATYLFINVYTVIKLSHHLPLIKKSFSLKILLLLMGFFFIIAKIYLNFYGNNFIVIIISFIGAFYLAFLNYMFFIFIFIDVFSFINKRCQFSKIKDTCIYRTGIATAVLIVILSHINIYIPVIKKYELKTDKKLNKDIKIVMISDIHLSNISAKWYWRKVVREINDIEPDFIAIAGDMIDNDTKQINEAEYIDIFSGLKSKNGVYSVLGNHEYYGKVEKNIKFIEKCNINLLQDDFKIIDDVNIVGRNDRHFKNRKKLQDIMINIDKTKYTILIDHTPNNLKDAKENNIDLKLSGHTHNGQFFPWNMVTKYMYEVDRGLLTKGSTNYIVSSGIGIWGPPIRNFSRPEIVVININSADKVF